MLPTSLTVYYPSVSLKNTATVKLTKKKTTYGLRVFVINSAQDIIEITTLTYNRKKMSD